jgi:hypothetical protein
MDFEAAVARGRALLAREQQTQWELAQLAYDVWHDGAKGDLPRWAERLGISLSHASHLKVTWERYGAEVLPAAERTRSFHDYYILARNRKERASRLERKADGEGRSVGSVERRGRDRDRLESARAYLRTRDGARTVLDDPKARAAVERELRSRAARSAPEAPDGLSAQQQQLEMTRELAALEHQLSALLGKFADLRLYPQIRARVVRTYGSMVNSLGWLRTFLGTGSGTRPMDEALDRILEEGAGRRSGAGSGPGFAGPGAPEPESEPAGSGGSGGEDAGRPRRRRVPGNEGAAASGGSGDRNGPRRRREV